MQKSDKDQKCFLSKDGKVRLCNCVDLKGDGQLWETKSGKWIPIPIENTPVTADVFPKESI